VTIIIRVDLYISNIVILIIKRGKNVSVRKYNERVCVCGWVRVRVFVEEGRNVMKGERS
jgi:hypothetical protein